jgi:hypothetical protein
MGTFVRMTSEGSALTRFRRALAVGNGPAAYAAATELQRVDLAEWTGGYPFFIQQLGKHAWNAAQKSPITRRDVETAIPSAQEALDSSL